MAILPAGWCAYDLGDLAQKIEGGGTPPRNEPSYWDGDIPWASVKDLRGVKLSTTEEFISELGLENSSSKLIPSNTMIIASRMAVGKAVFFNRDVAINQDLKAFYPKENTDGLFLLQWYLSQSKKIESLATGSTVKGIRLDDLTLLPIDLPPLPEQQKIAAILSSVDDVIEKTRAQIDKLKDLKTAMMQELLTKGIGHTEFKDSPMGRIPAAWDVVELGSVVKLERGRFSHRPRNDPQFYGGNIPFLQTGDIPKEAPQITVFSQTLNEKGLSVSKLFPRGTLVLTIAATIGEIGILEFDSCFPDSLVGLKVNQAKVKPMFILYLMRHLKNELKSLAPQTAQKNINLDILQPFPIPLPSIGEQELIANSMGSVDDRVNVLLEKLERIKNTKKALMQDLLTGKVRVKPNKSAAL